MFVNITENLTDVSRYFRPESSFRAGYSIRIFYLELRNLVVMLEIVINLRFFFRRECFFLKDLKGSVFAKLIANDQQNTEENRTDNRYDYC